MSTSSQKSGEQNQRNSWNSVMLDDGNRSQGLEYRALTGRDKQTVVDSDRTASVSAADQEQGDIRPQGSANAPSSAGQVSLGSDASTSAVQDRHHPHAHYLVAYSSSRASEPFHSWPLSEEDATQALSRAAGGFKPVVGLDFAHVGQEIVFAMRRPRDAPPAHWADGLENKTMIMFDEYKKRDEFLKECDRKSKEYLAANP